MNSQQVEHSFWCFFAGINVMSFFMNLLAGSFLSVVAVIAFAASVYWAWESRPQ